MGRAAKARKERRAAAAAAAIAGPAAAPPAGPPPAAASVPLRVNIKPDDYLLEIESAVTGNPEARITFGIESGQLANYPTLKAIHLEIKKSNRLKGRKDTFTMAESLNLIDDNDMPTGYDKQVGAELRFRG